MWRVNESFLGGTVITVGDWKSMKKLWLKILLAGGKATLVRSRKWQF